MDKGNQAIEDKIEELMRENAKLQARINDMDRWYGGKDQMIKKLEGQLEESRYQLSQLISRLGKDDEYD